MSSHHRHTHTRNASEVSKRHFRVFTLKWEKFVRHLSLRPNDIDQNSTYYGHIDNSEIHKKKKKLDELTGVVWFDIDILFDDTDIRTHGVRHQQI